MLVLSMFLILGRVLCISYQHLAEPMRSGISIICFSVLA